MLKLQYCEKLTGNFFITVPDTALTNLVSVIGLVSPLLISQFVYVMTTPLSWALPISPPFLVPLMCHFLDANSALI